MMDRQCNDKTKKTNDDEGGRNTQKKKPIKWG